MEPTLRATIIYLIDKDKGSVLMAKKTRKVGIGYWFGYGGKIDEGEDEDISVCRETKEESGGIELDPKDLERVALIDFYKGADRPFGQPTFRVLCYRVLTWKGESSSTIEMADPTFFPINNLPLQEMKPGDELFVPQILAGTPVKGWIRFTDDSKAIIGSDIKPCSLEDLVI